MKVDLSPEIQSNPILLHLVASANSVFESELGSSSSLVSAKWTLFTDHNLRPHLKLNMNNHGKCEGAFIISDLYDMHVIRDRFRNWCADLIQRREQPGW